MSHFKSMLLIALLATAMQTNAFGQGRPDPAKFIAAQQESMQKLAFMDGNWRGNAWSLLPSGEKHNLTQTERVGPMLDGSIKVVEGRGYDANGKTSFNAFATISYNVANKTFSMHSHAMGFTGDFPVTLTENGFIWERPAGPAIIRYTATFKDGTWVEVGDHIMPGKEPVRIFEMTLKRLGDSAWPGAGAVGLK